MCIDRARDIVQWGQGRVGLVFVGSGSPASGKTVFEELRLREFGARLVVDESKDSEVYTALGAKRGMARTMKFTRLDNLMGLFSYPASARKHGKPGKQGAGDPWLQGATLIVGEDGIVLYRQLETSPGCPRVDYASMDRVVKTGKPDASMLVLTHPRADRAGKLAVFVAIFSLLLGAALGAVGQRVLGRIV